LLVQFSNIDDFLDIPNEEVSDILRYLSSLHRKNELEAFVTFTRDEVTSILQVSSINMLWKEGETLLLESHSDVIYCDSIWNVSKNAYYGITIVVIDENSDIRLAAFSLVSREFLDSWHSFFMWVKTVVPSFNPDTIVTDGALYINDGFKKVVPKKKKAHHLLEASK